MHTCTMITVGPCGPVISRARRRTVTMETAEGTAAVAEADVAREVTYSQLQLWLLMKSLDAHSKLRNMGPLRPLIELILRRSEEGRGGERRGEEMRDGKRRGEKGRGEGRREGEIRVGQRRGEKRRGE